MNNVVQVETADRVAEWKARQCCIASHPRSGSHWLRRMLGEVAARRIGLDLSFGAVMNKFIGFDPTPINAPQTFKHSLPLFYATHGKHILPRIFLRRNFQDVLASCWKAEEDHHGHWFTGTAEEIEARWSETTTLGCLRAELVIDYDTMKQEPKAVVSSIFKHCGCEVTEEELDQAVFAGSRENMLKEQSKSTNRAWDIINELNY